MRGLLTATMAAIALVGLCPAGSSAEPVRVFAAASLTEPFREIAALYCQRHPQEKVELNFAGSQILRTQIEEGALADVFASADRIQMEALKKKNLIGRDAVFARNRLVVVTPRTKPKVGRLLDLARPGLRLVIADQNVPIGRYTIQVLEKMKQDSLLGDDFVKGVMANVVSQETSVRAVLAKVSLDEVDAGFVYATDAGTAGEKVEALDIPPHLNVVAEYPIAVLAKSAPDGGGHRFVALVLSQEGQTILAEHGFESVR